MNFFRFILRIFPAFCMLIIFPMTVMANAFMPYKQSFITTAYYSPLPDQEHYVTGSYYGDTRLNGNGTNGASGAEVFPGMLAAPKSYPFGFKIDIPGVGISEVQDRGGAIVSEGVRGNAHDRLDIWMGAGETGLRRALAWGKRTVVATVYGVRPELAITAGFSDWDGREIELVKYWKEQAPQYASNLVATLFPRDLWFGQTSDKVQEMQTILADLGYFFDDTDGHFDDATARAIYHFQRDNDIVYDWSELGAGHFGPHTRVTIEKAKELHEKGEYVNQTAYLEKLQTHDDLKEDFVAFTDELYVGVKGEGVRILQEELVKLGYLRIEPSGYYGDVTVNAVMRLQMKMGVITSKTDHGAGVVGPKTRAALNGVFDTRILAKGMIATKRDALGDSSVLLASTDTQSEEVISETSLVAESASPSESSEIVIVEDIEEIVEILPEPPTPLAIGSRGEDVKELQSKLRNRGYFHSGFLTTYFGEKTQSALIDFQLDHEIISSLGDAQAGVLTEATRQLLF